MCWGVKRALKTALLGHSLALDWDAAWRVRYLQLGNCLIWTLYEWVLQTATAVTTIMNLSILDLAIAEEF